MASGAWPNWQAGEQRGHQLAADLSTATTTVPRPTFTVIICAYTMDRWEDLRRAIASVRTQTEQPREVVLVIDHCPALLWRARQQLSGVVIAANHFEQGLSGSRNTGLAEAGGDVVAFLDDDAAADAEWIARLADAYQDSRVLGVGGLVRPWWEPARPSWFPSELDWVVGCSYQGMPTSSAPVRNFIGANMSFRRSVLNGSGGFSTSLGRVGSVPLGCEETELCLRVSQRYPAGVLLYEPAAAVSHWVRKQRTTWRYLGYRCYAEGLSKATVARLAGARRALASERTYVRSAIPRGLKRSLADAAHGRRGGLKAAFALVAAVAITGAGYLAGKVAAGGAKRIAAPVSRWQVIGTSRGISRTALAPWASLAACLALWAYGLGQVNVARMHTAGLGLVSVLPITFWLALAGLMISFCWSVTNRDTRWPVLAAHVVALVLILHATPAVLYETLRYSWAWKHVGVVSYIARNGIDFHLGGVLGVYQGWPGFFALNAFLTSVSGLGTALRYAPWVLPVNDLLWLGPVVLIARAFTSDQRLIWLAAWLFELGNWVGQDYFSPQAFAYFLYLTVLAVCLRWLAHPRLDPSLSLTGPGLTAPVKPGPREAAERSSPRPWVLVLCLVPLMAAIASSHQLTPFILIGALTMLVAFRQLRPWWLPVLMTVITVGWALYAGLPWLAANQAQVFGGLGDPWANTATHLIGQAKVPSTQILVDWGSRAVSAVIGLLAFIGFWRYRRHNVALARSSWNRVAVLAIAALPAAAANSYGGEIIFRVFLFALPFLAIAAAAAFFPHRRAAWSGSVRAVLAVITLALAAGFSLSNYGQEAMNYFSPQEVAASKWLYQTAPPGALIISADTNYPWAFVHYNWYTYNFLDAPPAFSRSVVRAPVQTIGRMMARSPRVSYLILTRSQAEAIRLYGTWPPAAYQHLAEALRTSGKFRVVYHNADAAVLQLAQ
jgi:glycosyltransferase involved in cell wall biosynthesis